MMQKIKMKMPMKKLVALVLVGIMIVGVLSGCGSKEEDKGSSEIAEAIQAAYVDGVFDPKSVTDGVELTIAVARDSLVEDYETNAMTKRIEEELGVDLTFLVLPSADYDSKMNLLVSGGDELPDIIFDAKGWKSWADEGVLVELSEFYNDENCSANIQEGIERAGVDLLSYLADTDGEIYAIPSYNDEIFAESYQKMWIYQPWLDALGLEAPTTIEEYYEYCKLVVANDMNGNGKADEVGLSGTSLGAWFDFLMSSFIYAHNSNWRIVEDGQVGFAFTTDEWKEGLKYIKKFFDEGLIPDVTLTQSSDSFNKIWYAEEVQLFSFVYYIYNGPSLETRGNYTCIPALEGPDGTINSCKIPAVANAGAVITTDCENPLAAFLVLDYMCNPEMSISQRFGGQGVDWDYWEDIKDDYEEEEFVPSLEEAGMLFYAYDMINWWTNNSGQNESYRFAGPYILDRSLMNGYGLWTGAADDNIRTLAELEEISVQSAIDCIEYQPEEVYDFGPLSLEEENEWADTYTNLYRYVNEVTGQFLMGVKDIDADWDSYIKELENLQYKEFLEVLQTAYDRVH